MSIRALSWISEKFGIDVTGDPVVEGQQAQPGKQENMFDKMGKAIFGQTEDELPSDTGWGYAWNPDTKRYEPTEDAPQHIKQEYEDRMRELTEPKKEIAPPPMVGADYVYHMQRAASGGPRYADHFNHYNNPHHPQPNQPHASSSPAVPALDPTLSSSGGGNYQGLPTAISPHASGGMGGHHHASATPGGAIQIPSLVSEAPASNLVHFQTPAPSMQNQPVVQWGSQPPMGPPPVQWGGMHSGAASVPSLGGVVNALPTAPATLQ